MLKQRAWLSSKRWGYIASLALVPYAILKLLWANGIAVLISQEGIEELHASMQANADPISKWLFDIGIDATALMALIASLLALALVAEWGKKLPRGILLAPAYLGGLFFVFISLVTFYKIMTGDIRLADNPDFGTWVTPIVYGGFFAWGVTVSMAAWSYGMRTRVGRSRHSAHWRKRWPQWTRNAAIVWTVIYGALGVYWSLGGPGFPLGLANDPAAKASVFRHAAAQTAGPVIVALCVLGIIALYSFKFKVRGAIRTILLAFAWSVSVTLCFFVMDARALIVVAYAPIALVVSIFGASLPFFEFITLPVVNQFVCLAGGLLWTATALTFGRRSREACEHCGRTHGTAHGMTTDFAARWGRRATYVAIISPAYYEVTRIAWLLGFPLGITNDMLRDLQESGAAGAGAGLALVSIGGSFLTRGLIKSWGETFPHWLPMLAGKRVPPALAIVPAGIVSILITVTGMQVIFDLSSIGEDLRNWGATTPLLLLPIWGITLGAASIFYYYRRRGLCQRCGSDRTEAA
ncbi:hypothetical protein ACVNS2_08340 [Paenibacillus caseinilyticus]|uniref:Uncharacterized protein n=1 Tax=Paenibacillus mucilaginosus K02 TaxID=997761 RepID=R9UL96_9BACL|nr:hypothetical protein [Paenibacillus mucilaginosus]AGN70619.1 hypothetical protein B2K_38895 [Paenibacillus mucilaginosus K02]